MSACERQADALMGYLYGELTPPEAEAFLAHARGCPGCSQELDGLGAVRRTVSRAEPLPDPHEALTARIFEAARAEAARVAAPVEKKASFLEKLMRPWVMGLAVAGAGAAALVLVSSNQMRMMSTEQLAKQAAPAPVVATAPAAPRDDSAKEAVLQDVSSAAPVTTENGFGSAGDAPKKARRAVADKVEREEAHASLGAKGGKADPRGGEGIGGLQGAGSAGGRAGPTGAALDEESAEKRPSQQPIMAQKKAAEPLPEPERKAAPVVEDRKADARPMASMAPAKQSPLSLPPPPPPAAAPPATAEAPREAAANKPASPSPDPAAEAQERPRAKAKLEAAADADDGAAGNALVVPGYKRDQLRMQANESSKALAKDMKTFGAMKNELRAQEELSAGTNALQSGQLPEALAAFQRAEGLHGGDSVALNARAGQATVLARMDRCGESVAIVKKIGQDAPRFSGRPAVLREVAGCFDRRRDVVTAKALREEADAAGRLASNTADQAETVVRAVRRDAAALLGCETSATAAGELPRAQGMWTVSVEADATGHVKTAHARGPAPAPGLQRCLEDLARNAVIPSLGAVTRADVMLPVQTRASAPQAAPPVRARSRASEADKATEAR